MITAKEMNERASRKQYNYQLQIAAIEKEIQKSAEMGLFTLWYDQFLYPETIYSLREQGFEVTDYSDNIRGLAYLIDWRYVDDNS